MTKTAPRHRAPLSLRDRAARAWFAVSALPVGALAGCTAMGVATSVDRPALGLLGLGAAVVPLSVATWRARLAEADPGHGRRAVGRPVPDPLLDPLSLPTTRLEAAEATGAVERLPIVLDVPDLASLQAATGTASATTGAVAAGSSAAAEADPSRLFTVAAGGTEVEVVVLTREERAARDLEVLRAVSALGVPAEAAADAGAAGAAADGARALQPAA